MRSLVSNRYLLLLTLSALFVGRSVADEFTPAGIEFFEKRIRPVLVEQCYECHSADSGTLQGGLLLDSRAAMLVGGDSGAAMVPKNLDESLVLSSLKYDSFEMPPSGKLPDKVIRDFEKWIEMGAPDPREASTSPVTAREKKEIDFDQAREFWSFQPPVRHPIPSVNDAGWIKTPTDGFILSQLEAAGLTPNERADRRTLIRRLNFAVLGLPPTVDEVEDFVADDSPNAWAKQIDRVLASPHYGERLGRLWLDVARYAEDQAHIVGNNKSLFYPNAYMYRDWVIEALNADMPYDEFVKRQLAADKMESENKDAHVALGFIGLGPKYYRRNAPEVMAEEWENHVDTVSRGLLGLTVACARCHDHKYDPIPTSDYYALAGVFASTEMYNRPFPEAVERLKKEQEAAKKTAEKQTDKDGKKSKAKKPKLEPKDTLHIVRDKNPRDINVQIRGDYKNKGELVERAFLSVLSPNEPQRFDEGSGRLQLAESIVDRDNPLAARVIVNRMWTLLVGKPLVSTASNLGTLGDRPTHPKLLDDLAVRFMEHDWSLKWLARDILMSSTWQQSSEIVDNKVSSDPSNTLLWRMERRRLDVEAWRDAILAVSGQLDTTIGGPSIDPTEPEQTRRTVYSEVSRLDLNPLLALFDFPDPNVHAASRAETTTPLQKLFVMNSPFIVKQAELLAGRCRDHSADDAERIDWVYQTLFGREVTNEERQPALEFLGKADDTHPARWQQYAQVLLASNEMLIVD